MPVGRAGPALRMGTRTRMRGDRRRRRTLGRIKGGGGDGGEPVRSPPGRPVYGLPRVPVYREDVEGVLVVHPLMLMSPRVHGGDPRASASTVNATVVIRRGQQIQTSSARNY